MFPKKGKVFPGSNGRGRLSLDYVGAVSAALRESVGDTHQAIKIVMRWTSADERTIKNWFAGTNGPSGANLIDLFRHSDEMLEACLFLAGRERIVASRRSLEVQTKLRELLALLEAEMPEPQ